MIEKTVSPRTYTVADLYSEAAKLVRAEFTALKSKPLSKEEEEKIGQLARTISKTVLKEMRIG